MFSSLRWGTVQEWRQLYWSYADVVSRGQMAGERLIMAERFGLIGYKPVHWGQPLWGQNDDQFRDQTIRLPAGKPPPLIITLRKCFPFCISQSSFTFIPFSAFPSLVISLFLSLAFLLPLILFFVLPLTPVAVELLMGCWAGEISPAADLFVGLGLCCFLFLLSRCVRVWMCVRWFKYAFVFG